MTQRIIGLPEFFCLLCSMLLMSCEHQTWNNPYSISENGQNILYSSFSDKPNHLDPAQSYVSNEIQFTGQIYEPPLQYHYLKRPYELIPLVATGIPEPIYISKDGQRLPDSTPVDTIAFTLYDVTIQKGIRFQPHPAFARDDKDNYRYHTLSGDQIDRIYTLTDFEYTDTRELVADDYVYQIKRLAHPKLHSPIFGLMSAYIAGLTEYSERLQQAVATMEGHYLDLNQHPFAGAEAIDRYTYRIKLKGKYPQMIYWLTMPFFAPVPWEADRFYSQPGLIDKNITLDWYPVGTGPYMLTENNPNMQMVMERNPNFHGEVYPHEGEPGDREIGLLDDAGKVMPFIDKAIYTMEKESIPYWNKFLQGYYDTSGISSDSFDQAISVGGGGEVNLTDEMKAKGIKLQAGVGTSIWFFAFNMLDPVVGGYSEKAQKIRHAISIAIDFEEFISIFLNGRGISAQGPLPPGIFGHVEGKEGTNPYIYNWKHNRPQRKSISDARQLLADAGYPNGVDETTGKPLIIYFDTTGGGPDSKARFDWYRKQFKKLDIQLVVRNTTFNRFQEKVLKGTVQTFMWGWNADYPDPENFLFLLYGPNQKKDKNGENGANYNNPEFDRLFQQMKNMDNSPERQQVIDEMIAIAQKDAPWIWGFYPKSFGLSHGWFGQSKPNFMANNTLKYKKVDPVLREQRRKEWNRPVLWPIGLIFLLLIVVIVPAFVTYKRKEHTAGAAVKAAEE